MNMKLFSALTALSIVVISGFATSVHAQHHLPVAATSNANINGGINSPTNGSIDIEGVATIIEEANDNTERKLHDMLTSVKDISGRRLSKSHKSDKISSISPENKVLALAFFIVGVLEIANILDESAAISIMTLIVAETSERMNSVRKLMEGAIFDKDDIKKNIKQIIQDGQHMMTGERRLQTEGTFDTVGLAFISLSALLAAGLTRDVAVERLPTFGFSARVVNVIREIYGLELLTTTTSTQPATTTQAQATTSAAACPIGPFTQGSVALFDACCGNEDCANFDPTDRTPFSDVCGTDPDVVTFCITEDAFNNREVDCSILNPCTCDSDCGPDEGPNVFPFCGVVGLSRCSDATRPTTGLCLANK